MKTLLNLKISELNLKWGSHWSNGLLAGVFLVDYGLQILFCKRRAFKPGFLLGAVFEGGTLESKESGTVGQVYKATKNALQELSLPIISNLKESKTAQIQAEGMGKRPVSITLQKAGLMTTNIRIRVGVDGDESISRLILAKIRMNL